MTLDCKQVITLDSKHGRVVISSAGETEAVTAHVADSIRKVFQLPPPDGDYAINDLMKAMGMQ